MLTCNRDRLLTNLLEALLPQLDLRDEVVILDTGAAESTRRVVESFGSNQVRYHAQAVEPFNFAVARNVLLKLAQKDTIAFIDDDALPLAGWLEEIRHGLSVHQACGGATLGQRTMPPWWEPEINWCVGLSPPGTILGKPGYYPDTCNMAARSDLWQAHPFDQVSRDGQDLYITGREDADWWMQRRIHGADVKVNWRQAVSHYVHPDRLSLRYVRERAYNDGRASWLRGPYYKAATDIPWDVAHIAGVVFDKAIRRPFNRSFRLADSIWMRRQFGKFVAVWNAPIQQRPRRRELVRQLAKATVFQAKIRAGRSLVAASNVVRHRGHFPPDAPHHIFVSADCFLGDSVLLRRQIYSLAQTFPRAEIVVSCKYPSLFTNLGGNVIPLPTDEAAARVRSGQFNPSAAVVPYFSFGDFRLWRERLAHIGVTFNCDVGFAGRRDYAMARVQVPKCMELHEHENLARLFNLWPLVQAETPPQPDIDNAATQELQDVLNRHGISSPFIALQLGSGHPAKNWSVESWKQFLLEFTREVTLPIVLVGASDWSDAAEPLMGSVGSQADIRWVNLCESRFELHIEAIRQAGLLIGACSGPKHLAIEFGVPTFTLYAASEPLRWGATDNHHLHGYVNALPQKLAALELQNLPVDHRINLLKPAKVANAALLHWRNINANNPA